MKVLHFFKTYWPDTFGGVERTIHAIARGTARLGVEPTVLSLSRSPRESSVFFDGHWAYKARLDLELASTGFSMAAFRHFPALARQADVIHCHFPWPFMDLVYTITKPKKPLVVTYHSDIVKQQLLKKIYSPFMHKFLARADRIIVTSANYFETSDVLKSYAGKVTVIPIGLDESDYQKPDQSIYEKWRSRFRKPFFVFTGVFRYYKGLDYLIEAASKVPFDIVLVGTGTNAASLKERSLQLGLKNVHFLGALDEGDKIALLDLCAGFVFPSHLRSEAYGLSLVEAAMAGKPMITCEIGTATSFINLNEMTGLVVPPKDPDALAAAMKWLVENEECRQMYGRNARARFDTIFKAQAMCEAYARVYTEISMLYGGK